jgi:catechol 2,3-dioxygenase-like lactoylglutathione lyase family enzyme
VKPRITVLTLAVADLDRAVAFYRDLMAAPRFSRYQASHKLTFIVPFWARSSINATDSPQPKYIHRKLCGE